MAKARKTTLDAPPRRGSASKHRPALRHVFGPEVGIVDDVLVPLDAGKTHLGREVSPDEGVSLADPRASRLHATLHVTSRTYKVRVADEKSRHGTWVNGARVEEAWLDDGDVIRLGDSLFVIRHTGADVEDGEVPELVGVAPTTQTLRATIQRAAPHDVTVLIQGESGTGKEVVARALHDRSGRKGSFLALNCAAIPEHLAESQLFGHVAGAFTGAKDDHPGFFVAADGGTLFLDEIGDMPPALQPKLLRALERGEVTPVGSTKARSFDTRIVVATHRDLSDAVEDGEFRGDLFARVAQFRVDVPPLRERVEDVLPLLDLAFGSDGAPPPLDGELAEALLLHPWPFNVREVFALAAELEVRGAGRDNLSLDLVGHRLDRSPASVRPKPNKRASGGAPSKEELLTLVEEHNGNVRAIARAAGRSRMQVYRWVEQYEVDLDAYRK